MSACSTDGCKREAQTYRFTYDVCNHCASDVDFEAADKAPTELDEYDREEMRL
jgi:hypothetical protein